MKQPLGSSKAHTLLPFFTDALLLPDAVPPWLVPCSRNCQERSERFTAGESPGDWWAVCELRLADHGADSGGQVPAGHGAGGPWSCQGPHRQGDLHPREPSGVSVSGSTVSQLSQWTKLYEVFGTLNCAVWGYYSYSSDVSADLVHQYIFGVIFPHLIIWPSVNENHPEKQGKGRISIRRMAFWHSRLLPYALDCLCSTPMLPYPLSVFITIFMSSFYRMWLLLISSSQLSLIILCTLWWGMDWLFCH